jgi:hypothetical protein
VASAAPRHSRSRDRHEDVGEERLLPGPRKPPVANCALASFFALDASHGEWKSPQPRIRNLVPAFDAPSVLAGLEPRKCGVNANDPFEPHLDERKFDLLLNVDISDLAVVKCTDMVSGRSFVADQR